MVAAARSAGRVLDVAFNHRRRGDVQPLQRSIEEGRLGRPYYTKAWWLRRTGIPTLGSLVHAAPRWRAAGRWWTSACTCSTSRCSCSATRRSSRSRASTYDLLGTNGFGGRRIVEVRRERRGDVRRRGPRDGLHAARRRRHAAARGLVGAAPRRRRPVRRDALRHRGRRRVVRRRLRAGRARSSSSATSTASPRRSRSGPTSAARIRRWSPTSSRRSAPATGRRTTAARRRSSPASSTPRTGPPASNGRSSSVRFVVLGAGAIGGVIGGGLYRAGHDVTLIARGASRRRAALDRADAADAGRRRGAARAGRSRSRTLRDGDVVILAVKSQDTVARARLAGGARRDDRVRAERRRERGRGAAPLRARLRRLRLAAGAARRPGRRPGLLARRCNGVLAVGRVPAGEDERARDAGRGVHRGRAATASPRPT